MTIKKLSKGIGVKKISLSLPHSSSIILARKVSKYVLFSGPYFPVFSPNTGKYGLEKLRVWTLLTQCMIYKTMLVYQVKSDQLNTMQC